MYLVRNDPPSQPEKEPRSTAEVLEARLHSLLGDYEAQCAAWTRQDASAEAPAEAKEYQARHAALKTALGHIELLLKLTRGLEAGAAADGEEDEAALEAEAARNLARPA